jgi:predicted nuclease of predicted toxin-antitoxin system
MPKRARIRFLLDEHYPGWLAEDLAADGVEAVALTAHRPGLRGADDQRVLEAAVAEGRVVVTAGPPPGLGEHPVVWWLAD